eukprot:9838880-Karenia_brevis.AAC.1
MEVRGYMGPCWLRGRGYDFLCLAKVRPCLPYPEGSSSIHASPKHQDIGNAVPLTMTVLSVARVHNTI